MQLTDRGHQHIRRNTHDHEFLALNDSLAALTADKHAWLLGLLAPLHKKLVTEITPPDKVKRYSVH